MTGETITPQLANASKTTVGGVPRKGDWFYAMGCDIEVRRVARDQSWADLLVIQGTTHARWTKRQPLPFPADWRQIPAQ